MIHQKMKDEDRVYLKETLSKFVEVNSYKAEEPVKIALIGALGNTKWLNIPLIAVKKLITLIDEL